MTRCLILGIMFCFIVVLGFEYNINYDRLDLAFHNKTFVKDGYFLFRKYNRTNFCLNISFILLEDLDGNDMKFTTTVYKLVDNTRKNTGLSGSFNVCEYWKKDLHGITKQLAQYGNLEGCDIKKGHYYLYNFMPDASNFPKAAPLGSYMMEIVVEWYSGAQILKLQWLITSKFILKRRRH